MHLMNLMDPDGDHLRHHFHPDDLRFRQASTI